MGQDTSQKDIEFFENFCRPDKALHANVVYIDQEIFKNILLIKSYIPSSKKVLHELCIKYHKLKAIGETFPVRNVNKSSGN